METSLAVSLADILFLSTFFTIFLSFFSPFLLSFFFIEYIYIGTLRCSKEAAFERLPFLKERYYPKEMARGF